MGRIIPLLLLFALLSQAVAQDLHTCSMHGEYLQSYENPLNDQWLSQTWRTGPTCLNSQAVPEPTRNAL